MSKPSMNGTNILWMINGVLVILCIISFGYKMLATEKVVETHPGITTNQSEYETFAALPQCSEQKKYTNARFVTVGTHTQVLLFSCGEDK